jgi:hypothetical protein
MFFNQHTLKWIIQRYGNLILLTVMKTYKHNNILLFVNIRENCYLMWSRIFSITPSGFWLINRHTRIVRRLKRDGTRAEARFGLSAKWTSPFKSAGASVQSTTSSRSVRISGSNARYTKFRGSVKHRLGTGYPLHSPVSPSLPLPASPCAITFLQESTPGVSNPWPASRMLYIAGRGHVCKLPLYYK